MSHQSTELLSLKDIASWQISNISTEHKIHARIPSLQRGAVWEPQQIELLWDSIFRGFPIGSIVLSNPIDKQHDKKQAINEGSNKKTTHHILDGQQRCNAIAWGFSQLEKTHDSVLWIDLQPNEKDLAATTRKFLFRLTTKAHPWGFRLDDSCNYLSTDQRRNFFNHLQKFKSATNDLVNAERPSPHEAFPFRANFPIPVSVLWKYFNNNLLDWHNLALDEVVTRTKKWQQSCANTNFTFDDITEKQKEVIENGLRKALSVKLYAHITPDTLSDISDIEQIFQRLNRQGTRINDEELAYSMMKAYWSELDEVMESIPNPPIAAMRLANIGVRIALTDNHNKISSKKDVVQIRKIFDNPESDDFKAIRKYFSDDHELEKSMQWIDSHILWHKELRSYGIPKFLRSSIAWSSQEVFALWMLLAKRHHYQPIEDTSTVKKLIGLSLIIHWFSIDKESAVKKVLEQMPDIANVKNFVFSASDIEWEKVITIPLSPDIFESALNISISSTEKQLTNWKNFWEGCIIRNEDGNKCEDVEQENRKHKYWEFINKLHNQRELLLYFQRDYIEEIFEGFDPSNKLMWKGHNRPWDYDHILPTKKISAQGSTKRIYTSSCQTWQKSIGNLRAIDFSFNRSAQDNKATNKYKNDEYITEPFNLTLEESDDFTKAKEYIIAAKNRMVKIYSVWFSELEISQLLSEK